MVTYLNDSFNRKKLPKKKIGRVFATTWFAIAFYLVFAKNRSFVQTFEIEYKVSRSDYEIQISLFENLVRCQKFIAGLIIARLLFIDCPIMHAVKSMQRKFNRGIA